MALKPKVEYVVTECEGRSGAVSSIFTRLERAEAHMIRVSRKPAFGVTAVELWESKRYERIEIPRKLRRQYAKSTP